MLNKSYILTGSITYKSFVPPFLGGGCSAFYLFLHLSEKTGNSEMLPLSSLIYPLICFTPAHHLLMSREAACDPFNDKTLRDFLLDLIEERTSPVLSLRDTSQYSCHMLSTTPVLFNSGSHYLSTYYMVLTHEKNIMCIVMELTDTISRKQKS